MSIFLTACLFSRVYSCLSVSIRVYSCLSLMSFWGCFNDPCEMKFCLHGKRKIVDSSKRVTSGGLRQPEAEPTQAQNGPGTTQHFQDNPEREFRYCQHLPQHVERGGVPRTFWVYSDESKNKETKKVWNAMSKGHAVYSQVLLRLEWRDALDHMALDPRKHQS